VSALASLFDSTRRDLKRAGRLVDAANALDARFRALTDEQLTAQTPEFRRRLEAGETLDDLLPEAFAAVREAARRTVGERHFDVQLLGAIMLHQGKIAEMRTGEGKTLTATLALYLNGLAGRGAHLVTVNDYLARRDATWYGPVYRLLGYRVGVIQSGGGRGLPAYLYEPGYHEADGLEDLRPVARGEAYRADVLYGTNSEFGFDYLRDNMVVSPQQLVQGQLYYAIVDEVDSILIDEARTPLIISGIGQRPTHLYEQLDRVVRGLQRETDYIVDEKGKTAVLTDQGMHRVERALNVDNLSDPENIESFQHLNAALRAHACYRADVDYVVKDGQVIIVDEFTGRLLFGRRYAEGLHQAIEAKEGVKIERESQTLATITYQNFFRLYDKLAGMTGTAKTEEQEFVKIYNLPAAIIPTNRPMVRRDHPDVVYKTEEAKFRGIVAEILQCHARGQPVLVGTRSIDVSERLSERLKPVYLQLFAQMALIHRALGSADHLSEDLRRALTATLKARLVGAQREREHLEAAMGQVDQNPARLNQPEEIRQLESRLRNARDLDDTIKGLLAHFAEGNSPSKGEIRRMAELICYQNLEEVEARRVPPICRALGIDPDPRTMDNLRGLAEIVGLDQDWEGPLGDVLGDGVTHKVLNAKYHEQEAHIIANAGRFGAVTLATNMAGRGVDILLGGNPDRMARDALEAQGIEPGAWTPEQYQAAIAPAKAQCAAEREQVLAAGGVHILGSERHESRRIDNQLRGRSGRQGDPGSSRFYASFQDELMRLFAPERLRFFLDRWDESEPVEAKLVSGAIETAQKKVEARNYESREYVLKYDNVMNLQREVIYRQRRTALEGADLKDTVFNAAETLIDQRLHELASAEMHPDDWDVETIFQALNELFPLDQRIAPDDLRRPREQLREYLIATVQDMYAEREERHGAETMRDLERMVTLRVIDTKWIEHLDAMDYLREGISLRGYGGIDPLIAYQKEAYEYWQALLLAIREDICRILFRIEVVREQPATPVYHPISIGGGDEEGRLRPQRAKREVGRNDPCPCGSGKKFKKCCMTKAA
jgi:preprotein translocase subunit SecA